MDGPRANGAPAREQFPPAFIGRGQCAMADSEEAGPWLCCVDDTPSPPQLRGDDHDEGAGAGPLDAEDEERAAAEDEERSEAVAEEEAEEEVVEAPSARPVRQQLGSNTHTTCHCQHRPTRARRSPRRPLSTLRQASGAHLRHAAARPSGPTSGDPASRLPPLPLSPPTARVRAELRHRATESRRWSLPAWRPSTIHRARARRPRLGPRSAPPAAPLRSAATRLTRDR